MQEEYADLFAISLGKSSNFCMMCMMEKHVVRCFNHNMNEAIAPKLIVGRLRSK